MFAGASRDSGTGRTLSRLCGVPPYIAPSSHSAVQQQLFDNMGLHCAGPLICRPFFNKHTACPSYPQVSISGFNQLQVKKVFLIHSRESVDVEGWLYALSYIILYQGLEHPRIWVSAGLLEPIPCGYCWMTIVKFGSSQKLQLHGGQHS